MAEIIADGRTGRLVPEADGRRLAAVLRELSDDPGQARRLGEAAATDVRARFGLRHMIAAVEERYERLLEAAR